MYALLFCALLFGDESKFQQAKDLTHAGAYEDSEALLDSLSRKNVDQAAYHYYRLVNAFSLNQREKAAKQAALLNDWFGEMPDRYRVLAFLMMKDMEQWEEGLGDIARDMRRVQDRLNNAKGGPQTQEIQKSIVSRLDKMIKEAEDEAERQKQQQKEAEDEATRRITQGQRAPQDDSQPGQDSGPGAVDPKKFDNLAKNWGKLPEKQRAKAMQEMTRDLPPKYREVIETYFRRLAQYEGK